MNITLSDGTKMTVEDSPFSPGVDGDLFWSEDKKYVVKLFHADKVGTQVRGKIERLLGEFNLVAEDPSRESLFAWPDALVTEPRVGFRTRAVSGRSLESFVSKSVWEKLPGNERGNWLMRVYVAYQIARIVRWTHARGLCYSGILPANFITDLASGQVTMNNCDAIVLPGEQVLALNLQEYAAPEIEMGKTFASADLDKHTLAVLIYQVLFMRHPLLGPKVHSPDPKENERLSYGKRALYIEHPSDQSNRPSHLPVTVEALPNLIRELFKRAFVDGLHDPSDRPSAAEWETVLLRMADQVITCSNPACSMQSYVVQDKHKFECPWCKTSYQVTAELPIISLYRPGSGLGDYVFDNWAVVGWPNRALMMYHVDPNKIPELGDASFLGVYFELDGTGKWFLINEALENARVVDGGSKPAPFKPGDRVQLKPDLKILMGPEQGFRAGFVQMLHPVTPKKPETKLPVPVKPQTPIVVDARPRQEVYALEKNAKYYSESELWNKIKKFAQQAGQDIIEKVLVLYFAAQSPDTPAWAKAIIYGALGYFILPVDAIPDMIPVVGLTDDLAALAAAIGAVTMSITPAVRMQAKKKLLDWFGKL